MLVVPRDCPLLGNDLIMFDELYKLAQVCDDSDSHVKEVTQGEARKKVVRHSLGCQGWYPTCTLSPWQPPNCAHPKVVDKQKPGRQC